MAKHSRHQDSLNVQIRTKFLDKSGHEMPGVIEYDPATGYGKRVKDAQRGLIEDFYAADGSVEIDGHNFDDTNHDEHRIAAIKTLINMGVTKNSQAGYNDLLDHHTKLHQRSKMSPIDALAAVKAENEQKQKVDVVQATGPPQPSASVLYVRQKISEEKVTNNQAKQEQ